MKKGSNHKALIVHSSGGGCLRAACDYVHLNPVQAKWLRPQDRLMTYPWTSLVSYAAAPEHHWIRVHRLLGEDGIRQDNAPDRQQLERRMEARPLEETDEEPLRILHSAFRTLRDTQHSAPYTLHLSGRRLVYES